MSNENSACSWAHYVDLSALPEGELRINVVQALGELMQDEEAQKRIQHTAERTASGRVQITSNNNMITGIRFDDGDIYINISNRDSGGRYYSPEVRQFCDLGLQEMLFHEFSHAYLGHLTEKRDDEVNMFIGSLSPTKEAEAIADTNAFRERRYGRPPRILNEIEYMLARGKAPGDLGGTPGWDLIPGIGTKGGFLSGPFHACAAQKEGPLPIPPEMLNGMRKVFGSSPGGPQ